MSFTGPVAGQSLTPYIQGTVTTTATNGLSFPGVTGSYLNLGTNSPVHFSTATSNLFVEAWVNFNQNAYTEYIAGTLYSTTTDDWGFRVDGTFNRFMFYHYNTSGVSTAVTAPSGTPVIQGTWYHVAASFATTGTNGTIYLYVNGTLQNAGGTSIGGTPRYTSLASAFIGTPSPLPGGWVATNAYMRDVRIVKDGIVPTTSFTPDATPWYYQTLPSYMTGGTVVFGLYGQYLGRVSQLTASASGSGVPVDLAPSPATVPSAKASPIGPFTSEGSLSFTGTGGTQVNASKFPFNWYTGFTVEAWVYYTSFTNALASSVVPLSMGLMQIAGNIADWAFGPDTLGRLRFYYYFNGQNAQLSSNTMSTGTWTHICAQHDGTSFHMYINGVRCVGPVTITGAVSVLSDHTYFSFGQYNGSAGPTYKIADVRLVQGSNVYPVTGFTPPTDKLTVSPVGTTVFLMQVPLSSSAPASLTGQPLFSQLSTGAVASATGVFSLKAVNGTTARALRIKRQSDGAQQDFWADRLGNLLTAPVTGTSLQAWLAGSTANVVTWYDQSSAGNHVSQLTSANQPVMNFSNASISFNGSQWFSNASPTGMFIPLYQNSYSIVTKHIQWTAGGAWSTGNTASFATFSFNGLRWAASNYYQNYRGGGFLTFGPQPGTYPVIATVVNNRTIDIGYINGVQSATQTGITPNIEPIYAQYIGYDANSGSNRFQGELQAVVSFGSALSTADRTVVETLI